MIIRTTHRMDDTKFTHHSTTGRAVNYKLYHTPPDFNLTAARVLNLALIFLALFSMVYIS